MFKSFPDPGVLSVCSEFRDWFQGNNFHNLEATSKHNSDICSRQAIDTQPDEGSQVQVWGGLRGAIGRNHGDVHSWLQPFSLQSRGRRLSSPSRSSAAQLSRAWSCLHHIPPLTPVKWPQCSHGWSHCPITLSHLLGRRKRGSSRIFTHILAKRLMLLACLFSHETWICLGNFSCKAACFWGIMWCFCFSSLYFIFAFFFISEEKFTENTGIPERVLELVLGWFSVPFDLETWCPYHQSQAVIQKTPKASAQGLPYITLLDLLICYALYSSAPACKSSSFPRA